ncbi:sporulation integral membrane protein YtvI [Mobilitalea sibirica]|uniref:Sporulation integral membrane protein YtvI n=1 Tax=Mobilitalea sibirica TaxID=1462919 RepID=A0A8J7HDB9_9FIRM|nr:sporulation integral membrane protein YtvI [Mobilitalea sibirica]MBH1941887.1 sporulation integral membrane protein YtvI [Mobilitalea sibirica]
MKSGEGNNVKLKWFLTIIVTTVGVYLSFRFILPLILPFLVAYFLAWIIRPLTEFLYRRLKLPRVVGGTFSLLVLVGLVGTGCYYLCNALIKQAITLVKNIPVYFGILAGKLDYLCKGCDELFGLAKGTIRSMVDDNMSSMLNHMKTSIMPDITQQTITVAVGLVSAVGIILIILIATVLIVKDLPDFHKRYESNALYKDVHAITSKLSEAGIAWLRTQAIIMSIVAVICVLGLTLLKNEYALLLGIGIAFMDALPILGSGIVFIPWIIIMLISGNIYAAAILATIYLIAQIVREVLEPKLIGNRIGVKPLFTLIAMYIGLNLFSIAGFILGPVGLIMIITIVKVVNDRTNQNSCKQEMPL